MDTFLQRLAKLILERHRDELDRVAVVLPGRRAGLHLRKYLANAAGRTLWSPELFDPGAFMQRISGVRQGGSTEMLFLLYQAHCDVEGGRADGLNDFLKWAPVTLRDLSETDAHLLDHGQFYRDLRSYHEIETWSFHGSGPLSPSQERTVHQWARTGALHARFSELMRERGVGTSGHVAREAANALRDPAWRSPWAGIWIAGLNALDPSTTEVVRNLTSRSLAHVAWDADHYYVDDPHQEAGKYLRRSIRDVGAGLIPSGDGIRTLDREVKVVELPNRLAQVHYAAQQLKELSAPERARTVVILADESLLLPLIEALPPDLGPMNITLGLPLSALPAGGLIEAFLRVHIAPDKDMRLADLELLLLHPFLHEGDATARLIQGLHARGITYVDRATFTEEVRKAGFQQAGAASAALAPQELPSDMHDRVRQLIAWAKACRANDSLAVEQLFRAAQVEQALEEALERYAPPVQLDAQTHHLLRQRALRDEQLALLGEPLTGLQVMGLLETRSLDHERVILLGANEESLPGGTSLQSWIPFDLRRHYGLPLPSDAQAIAAYHVHRLLHHATDVSMLCHSGGDGSGEPSRFIAQWVHELEQGSKTRIDRRNVQVRMAERAAPPIAVDKTDTLLVRLKEMALNGFSPTAIGTWLRCPLDFYFTQVLKVRAPEQSDGKLGSDVLGTAVHRVLERIYRAQVGTSLQADLLTTAAAEAHHLLRAELRKEFPDRVLGQGHFRLRAEMASQAISNYLHREAERCARTNTIPLALESKLTASLVSGISVRGTCDRMEERNGLMHVLDLKTGSARPEELRLKSLDRSELSPDHRYALQLMVYAYMAFQQDPGLKALRAGIVPLRRPSDSEGIWLTVQGNNVLDRSLMEPMGSLLTQLIHELMDPNTPFRHDPESEFCTCCVR